MTSTSVIVPFRDRGTDPLRSLNLTRVLEQWSSFGSEVLVVSDGGTGAESFNRHRAYNRGAKQASGDVLIYAESDMLIRFDQIDQAVELAAEKPRLVVPFDARHELGPEDSQRVRNHQTNPENCTASVVKPKPRRVGAINVVSREALSLVGGWDESFSGAWWDDRSMELAFSVCTNPTVWVEGPSFHLYHLPGYQGAHLTAEDRAATRRNSRRFLRYERARTPEQIRQLTMGNRLMPQPGEAVTTLIPAREGTAMEVLMKNATEAINKACANAGLSHGPVKHISSTPWTEPLTLGSETIPPMEEMVLHRFKAVTQ